MAGQLHRAVIYSQGCPTVTNPVEAWQSVGGRYPHCGGTKSAVWPGAARGRAAMLVFDTTGVGVDDPGWFGRLFVLNG